MALPVLITSKYVPVGTYIGQIIRPRPGAVVGTLRYPAIVGKGNRLAQGTNLGIYRAFVYNEVLTVPTTAPFKAVLQYQANGSKDAPVYVRKGDGSLVPNDQWYFTSQGGVQNKAIIINTEAYDSTATYQMDYQSVDRDVLDPIPVNEIREISAVGNTEDQSQYQEYVDYIVNTSVSDPLAATTNAYTVRGLEAPAPITVVGTGVLTQDISSIYLHNYNRYYTLKCLTAVGTSPNRIATFEWTAIPISAGNSCVPPVPLHSTATAPVLTVNEASAATLVQELEQGIKINFAFGATHFTTGDEWEFNAFGPGLVEKDDRYNNTNQYTESSAVAVTNDLGAIGTGVATVDVTNYASTFNSNFQIECTAKAGTPGSFTGTFVWAMYGDTQPFASGTFNMVEATSTLTFTLSQGISVTLAPGLSNFNVGDKLTFKIYAPMIQYQGKDNREITLTATSVVETSLKAVVSGSYTTDTPEGSFGTFSATAEYGNATDTGKFQLNDNIIIAIRNVFKQSTPYASRIQSGDIYSIAAVNEGTLDWSLTDEKSEQRIVAEIYNDVNGNVTGTPNTWYTILTNIPVAGTVTVLDALSAPVSFTLLTDSALLTFVTKPTTTLTITYKFKGAEPDPGQLYFLTATYLRPDELYDTPIFVSTRDEGRQLLAPSTAENHLYIANDIAWDHNVSGVYVIQVKDADNDGIYNNSDFSRAILATEETTTITDRIVLSNWGTLSVQLAVNIKANDPFSSRESIDWFGTPIGTPIGDATTPDTLRYYARNSLQVYGNSPAHGTRVLHGATWCKKTVSLSTGVTQQVTLDGSFVDVALASLVSSFTDPAATILHKNITGFDEIQTYGETDNVLLGSSSIVYFNEQSDGVYIIKEDVTVDTLAPEYHLISGTVQRHMTVKRVRTDVNPLISTIVVTGQAGRNLIQSQLAGSLLGMISKGLIAPYQTEDGAERKFDPGADIDVRQDSSDPTLYHFLFAFWIKKPIKRLFGLYSVDSNDFGA